MLAQSTLDKLASVDSSTISNLIELFDVQPRVAGYANETIKALYPDLQPVVGYAVTSTFRGGYSTGTSVYGNTGGLLKAAEQIPAPRILVVQDLDDPIRAAVYGEVMVSCLIAGGYKGLVTNGAGRDFLQVKELDFSCFASSVIVSHGYANILDVGVEVMIGGLSVAQGDLVHADANGVVRIPHDLAPHMTDLIDPFMKTEELVMAAARAPGATADSITEEINAHYGRLDKLREEANRRIR